MKSSSSIEITASVENYEKIYSFVEEKLGKNNISREIRTETFLVLEALFHNILRQGFDGGTLLTIKVRKSFGEVNIYIGFEGRPFVAVSNEPYNSTPEDDILRAYEDKFDYSYACYILFSRMLQVVMYAFPFFCFLALLYPLLGEGYETLLLILSVIALSAASLVVLVAFYLIRLLIGGVKIRPFLKHFLPLLKENFEIGSAIDAVPFNIRYCVRKYGMNRNRIADKFTVLAQLNLDGNCYLIMLIAMLFIFMMGSSASWYHIVVIAILVVFLSFGAPNQPGSILIGTLIVAMFLQGDVLISTAVYLEVFFGGIQNIINVTGDVVTVAIEEKQVWK